MSVGSRGVSVVHLTHRPVSCFDWFADSLASQIGDDDVEVIAVDGLYSLERGAEFSAFVRGRFPFRHVPPKPTPYNGPRRRTRSEYFAAASARNTGIVYATKPYVAFVDDLSVLMPGWWSEVRSAAAHEEVVAGSYRKEWNLTVRDGKRLGGRCEPIGIDSRWPLGNDNEIVPVRGGQLFGCSLGVPRDLLVEVNGFDELCDSIGGEDWQLGLRLEWAGAKIGYSRRMLTIESEELHRQASPLLRVDRTTTPSAYIQRLSEFGVSQRHIDGNWDSSHMILDIAFGLRSRETAGNYYRLSALRVDTLTEVERRFPRVHWFDGVPLSEL